MNSFHNSYLRLKQSVLECYFDFARDRGVAKNWPREQVVGGVAYEFESISQTKIGKLMIDCLLLSLVFDLPEYRAIIEKNINESLLENDVRCCIENMSDEDKKELKNDLKNYGFSWVSIE